jgi:intracellular sulfur oxidation DsrE/DsrF family protein
MISRIAFFAAFAIAVAAHAKDAKVVYDVTEGNGEKLFGRIETIDESRERLIKQGITPRFVLSFRGPATKLVQTDIEKIKPEDRQWAAKIAERLAAMSKAPGVSLEQCAVAIQHQGTSRDKVLPVIKVVDDSFITIARYQSKGYAYILP